MKKLAIILLIGVYAVICCGTGRTAVYCCSNAMVSSGAVAENQETADDHAADCNEIPLQEFSIKPHHHAGTGVHFSSRNYAKYKAVITPAEMALVALQSSVSLNYDPLITTGSPVPVYLLNCVYRL